MQKLVTGQHLESVSNEHYHQRSVSDLASSESNQGQFDVEIGARKANHPKSVHSAGSPTNRTAIPTINAICTIVYRNHKPSCSDCYAEGTYLKIKPDVATQDWNRIAKIGFQFICTKFRPSRCRN